MGGGSEEHRDLRGYLQQQLVVLLEEAQRARRLSAGPHTAGPFHFNFSNLSCLSVFDVLGAGRKPDATLLIHAKSSPHISVLRCEVGYLEEWSSDETAQFELTRERLVRDWVP